MSTTEKSRIKKTETIGPTTCVQRERKKRKSPNPSIAMHPKKLPLFSCALICHFFHRNDFQWTREVSECQGTLFGMTEASKLASITPVRVKPIPISCQNVVDSPNTSTASDTVTRP